MEQFVDSEGVRLWTISEGSGIPVVLCNGGPGCCDYLAPVAAMLDNPHPLTVIVLCPRPEVVAARDAERAKTGYADQADVYAFDRVLRSETPRMGYWLDNSDLTITETVDRMLEHLPQASV